MAATDNFKVIDCRVFPVLEELSAFYHRKEYRYCADAKTIGELEFKDPFVVGVDYAGSLFSILYDFGRELNKYNVDILGKSSTRWTQILCFFYRAVLERDCSYLSSEWRDAVLPCLLPFQEKDASVDSGFSRMYLSVCGFVSISIDMQRDLFTLLEIIFALQCEHKEWINVPSCEYLKDCFAKDPAGFLRSLEKDFNECRVVESVKVGGEVELKTFRLAARSPFSDAGSDSSGTVAGASPGAVSSGFSGSPVSIAAGGAGLPSGSDDGGRVVSTVDEFTKGGAGGASGMDAIDRRSSLLSWFVGSGVAHASVMSTPPRR